ncbi:MAG: class I SAM-dependent methyltransferase [Acidimicrobiales bacterium]
MAPRPRSTDTRQPPVADPIDDFHTRTVEYVFHGARLRFDLARSLFSSAGIDPGSALLLRFLQDLPPPVGGRVLDLGCGIGTLGIVLLALDPDRRVTFVDRDALALRYTEHNLRLNGFDPDDPSLPVRGSLGYDALDPAERFDLVVSNIPGKAGHDVIDDLVSQAARRGRPGAVVGFVVVNPLAPRLAARLGPVVGAGEGGTGGNDLDLVFRRANKTHEVFLAVVGENTADGPPSTSGFERGLYDRETTEFRAARLTWHATTVVGLGEFDTLSYATRLFRGALQGVRAQPATVVNPGQGHRAVVAGLAGYRPDIVAGRDLLALHATRRALAANGLPVPELRHRVDLDLDLIDGLPLCCLHADDKVHAPWFYAQVARWLDRHDEGDRPAGGDRHLVLSGRASLLGRLEADLLSRRRRGRVAYKRGERGFRVVRFTR